MRTGEFKHWISFLFNSPNQDPVNGDLVNNEVTAADAWAKITPMSGNRALNAGQILNGKPYDIQVRYRGDVLISEEMAISWNGKRLAIHSVIDQDAANEVFSIVAYEVR